jgi:hypothetical protein
MKGHKGHHHGHVEHGVHHKHPRAEHKKGGKVESPMEGHWDHDESPKDVYAGANSEVAKEAKKRKHGGMAKHKHHVGHHEGHHAHHHAGRKPRKSGGAASGSNMHPLSSAHKGMEPKSHKSYEPEEH